MSNDNKTLADVQPGGRVRLGDAPWPEIDAILADAYSAGAEGLPFEGIARRAAVRKAVAALSAQPSQGGQAAHCPVKHCGMTYARVPADGRCHACGATVQPSPGGQDALAALQQDYDKLLDSFNRQVEVAEKIAGRVLQQNDRIEELEEALAARQPVYEGHTWVSDYVLAGLRERAALPLQLRNGEVWHWQGDGHDFPESLACPVIMSAETLRALLAARQPVGEPAAYIEHFADKVSRMEMTMPGLHLGIGRHPVYAAPPAQAVDLGPVRDVFRRWHANELNSTDAMLALVEALAVIDSQAAGK